MLRGRRIADHVLDSLGSYLRQTYRGARMAPPNPSSRDRYTVVLRKDVEGVGQQGDVIKVRHGYARNALIPAKLAVPATRKNIELYGARVRSLGVKQAEGLVDLAEDAKQKEVEAVLKALAAKAVEIKRPVKTVEKDGKEQPTTKLEEPVTSSNVVEAVAKQRRVELVEQILYMDPIEEIGEFDVPLRMTYPDGQAPTFRLKIIPAALTASATAA